MLYILMEKRTLVKSGASSFTIALPINWVRKNKLEKGSEVSLEENEVGDILIHAELESFFKKQEYYTIKVTPENLDLLYWELLRAYLKNYSTINLEGDNISIIANPILQRLNNFIGLDIIEQTKNVIVLKNFSLSDTETTPYSLLKKVDVGVRAMIEDLKKFFLHGFHHENVAELKAQNEYNERVYLFSMKLINNIINIPSLMRVFKTDYKQLLREHTIINTMRQISLHISMIGKLLLFVEHTSKSSKYIEGMLDSTYQKYRIVISAPKNPLSTDMLDLLRDSEEKIKKWGSYLKEIKNPSIIEIISSFIVINTLLDQLSLSLVF